MALVCRSPYYPCTKDYCPPGKEGKKGQAGLPGAAGLKGEVKISTSLYVSNYLTRLGPSAPPA